MRLALAVSGHGSPYLRGGGRNLLARDGRTRVRGPAVAAVTYGRDDLVMFSAMLAAAVLVATFLQTKTSAKEVSRANRSAMEWWDAEDQLVAEQRWWWRRWATRRLLRSWRDQDTAEAIRHVQTVLVSWMMLLIVALVALGRAIWDWAAA